MAIRASSSKQIDALIVDVAGADDVAREAAIARLIVIGARSVSRLLDLAVSEADGEVRAAALRALEGIGDDRALSVALQAADDRDVVAARAAVSVARRFLRGPRGAEIVDRLTAIALDTRRTESVRISAITALRDLDRKTIAPIMKALAVDSSSAVRTAIQGAPASEDAQHGPDGVRTWLAREGSKAPLSSLLGIVERVRERETSGSAAARDAWTGVRFATHLVLAKRGSRVALFDLRESLERTLEPLPTEATAALALAGNASCLDAIASAYTRSKNVAWRQQLLEAFQTIVKREKLTPRHAVMRRIAEKHGWAGKAGGTR